jgi:hypothetical protein
MRFWNAYLFYIYELCLACNNMTMVLYNIASVIRFYRSTCVILILARRIYDLSLDLLLQNRV